MKAFFKRLESFLEAGGIKKDIILLFISGVALIISIFDLVPLPFNPAWIAVILCGVPIILEAITGLITEFDIKADVLVSLALVASICIGEDFAAGEVAFIMRLGALLEELTVTKARAGIEKLVHLTPRTARIIKNGGEKIVPSENVNIGDIIRVQPGEIIPADGIITSGETSVNQAVMTGESLPVDKTVNDDVYSGTVNQFGTFEMKATKAGEDSSIQRIIRLIQTADADKAKIVGIADRWATWIVIIALAAAVFTWLISGQIIRAVTILVVFCPCALVLATPTAIMAAIGNAARHGILVREGDALERLALVTKVVFDKTGTLTYGKPKVTTIKSFNTEYTDETLYKYAAAAEQFSEHPLGKAIVQSYKQTHKDLILKSDNFYMKAGKGVSAIVDGNIIIAGNREMLKENGVDINESITDECKQYLSEGSTIIYVAVNKVLSGYIVLSDTMRSESGRMIESLKNIGIEPVLLTGDNVNSAETIAHKLNISEVNANCLPEDKLKFIDRCQESNQPVCMIGDGVNDAPALKRAMAGIAMGGIGSDIAVDAADIALVNDEIKELPHLFSLSKKMMLTIKCNLSFSMLLNFAAIILAITGILNPIVGALVHNAGSVIVIINSALLLKWRKKK